MTMKSSLVKKPQQKQITLAIDFDDVIRDNFTKKPIKGVKRAMNWLESKGIILIISTANKDLEEVKRWLKKNKLNYPVTDKKVSATAYIDNRAIRFTNWNDITSYF